MTSKQRVLFLVRHAKSSWKDASLPDIERPLNKRGKRNAPLMADWLMSLGDRPELILSSPANRALTTARAMAGALQQAPEDIQVEQDLYFAGTHGMLRALERVDDRFHRVMMVGHNPVMTRLLNQLTGADVWNMPTCAIAVIGFDMESWGLVDSTAGKLLAYQTPKLLDAES
ncbi:MAG: histidine phosphatase family protein [Xanthomonadales bacterium]|jgi:phosphohistidine phosphatase|nr:histidine phosphatase family protein [Xanthomonadales bacterium]